MRSRSIFVAPKHTRCEVLAQAAQPFAGSIQHCGVADDSEVVDPGKHHHSRFGIEAFHQRRVCLGDVLLVLGTDQNENMVTQRGGTLYPLPASSVLGIPTRLGSFVRTRLFSWAGKLRRRRRSRRAGDPRRTARFSLA